MHRQSVKTFALEGTAAIATVATMIGVMYAGSTLITPLYVIYEQTFGFSRITLTVVYAVYVIGNLSAMLFVGRLSDRLGRRLFTLVAMAIGAMSILVFLFANGPVMLSVGRVLSGFGIAIATGTGSAWLVELMGAQVPTRGATIATGANFLGIAFGPLVSGLLAQYAPLPLHLSFIVYLLVIALTAIMVGLTRETVVAVQSLAEISLRPRIGVPRALRGAFIAPGVAGMASLALVGFYAALAPSILAENLHLKSHALAGVVVFELGIIVAAAIFFTRNVPSRVAMLWALALLIPAVLMIVVAQANASLSGMIVGTALCGVGSGMGYRAGLQVVNEIAPDDRRAELVSAFYICCFTGNALPVIGVAIITGYAGAIVASVALAVLMTLFAVVAFGFAWKFRR